MAHGGRVWGLARVGGVSGLPVGDRYRGDGIRARPAQWNLPLQWCVTTAPTPRRWCHRRVCPRRPSRRSWVFASLPTAAKRRLCEISRSLWAAVITMRWDGFAPGCETIGVGLSDKVNNSVVFDFLANQYGSDGVYCGPGGAPCVAPYQLTLTVGERGGFTCFQVDAHLGPQLAVIGPEGAYYELNNTIYPTLISAFNGGSEPCRFTTCVDHVELPAASIECRVANEEPTPSSTSSTSSTSTPATPSTQPQTVTTTAPSVTSAGASTTMAAGPTSTAAISTDGTARVLAARAVNPPQTLPATGSVAGPVPDRCGVDTARVRAGSGARNKSFPR